jgi:DnaJ domain
MSYYAACYTILEIESTADRAQIRRAYSRLAKIHRPDTSPEKFQELRVAYEQALELLSYTEDQTSNEADEPISIQSERLTFVAPIAITKPPSSRFQSSQFSLDPFKPNSFEHKDDPSSLPSPPLPPLPTLPTLPNEPNFSSANSNQLLRLELDLAKRNFEDHLRAGVDDKTLHEELRVLLKLEALDNLAWRFEVENWLINLAAYAPEASLAFAQAVADIYGFLDTASKQSGSQASQILMQKIAVHARLAQMARIASIDPYSAESLVLNGGGYFKLLWQLLRPKDPKARHRIDEFAQWLEDQYTSKAHLINQPTLRRWRKLDAIATVSTLTLLIGTLFTWLILSHVFEISVSKFSPVIKLVTFNEFTEFIAWVTFGVSLLVIPALLFLLLIYIGGRLVKKIQNHLAAKRNPRMGATQIFIALVCITGPSLCKLYPQATLPIGVTALVITLLYFAVIGVLQAHSEMTMKRTILQVLGFLLLTSATYVGAGGIAAGQSYSNSLPALLSSGAAFYLLCWPTSAITRSATGQLSLDGKEIKLPHRSILFCGLTFLSMTCLSSSFTAKSGYAQAVVGVSSLWLLYLTLLITGVRALQRSFIITFGVIALFAGAIFIHKVEQWAIGALIISGINLAILGQEILEISIKPFLQSTSSLKWIDNWLSSPARKTSRLELKSARKPDQKTWLERNWFWALIGASTVFQLLLELAK